MVYDFHVRNSSFGVHGYQLLFDMFEKYIRINEFCNHYVSNSTDYKEFINLSLSNFLNSVDNKFWWKPLKVYFYGHFVKIRYSCLYNTCALKRSQPIC